MIQKNTENFAPEINLFPIQGRNIELSFNGDRISSDGGLLLLRELDARLNLLSSASNCIHDKRDHRFIDHSVKELLIQRVFQIAAGYEDCNDCNDLREDMIFKMCVGRLPKSEKDLASQPTMSRLENTVTKTDLFRLGKCLVDVFISSYSEAPSVIILDCDDTNNYTYGQQELALFNNYYSEYCYMPIHIKEGFHVPMHQHENEQITQVHSGVIRFWFGENKDQVMDLGPGEMVVIPPNLPHEALMIGDVEETDNWAPPRTDWLDGTDTYLKEG